MSGKRDDEIRPDDPASIRRMFRRLAPAYDRLNTILTFGLVHSWRRALVRAAAVGSGTRVLDVATGTGRTLDLLRDAVGASGLTVGLDFTPAMIERARGMRVLGDALRLPFPDGTFDAAVSSFALRDIADQAGSLAEMARVTRPGGTIAVLEIGRPSRQPFRLGFDLWFRGVVPKAGALAGQGESHRFLVRSIDYLPEPDRLRALMEEAGVEGPAWRDLTLGAARLFVGRRPG